VTGTIAAVMVAGLVLGQNAAGETEPKSAPILIDWIHANDFSMVGLRPEIYDYHAAAGFRHGFDYLATQGFSQEYLVAGRLTPERLAGHRLLFINLVSAEREPFLVSEVMAIRSFVAEGGSLLVITDHSNCYFHSHRLKPLLSVLGIRSFTDTACEGPEHALADGGPGWIGVSNFRKHPVTAGLERIAMQTGGLVDPRYAVALTSDESWADAWAVEAYGDSDEGLGLYGNFKRDEEELSGPHGVVLAKEFHRGRVVIAADQNMFSDGFLHYADNHRLWLNMMAWLLRETTLTDWKAYEQAQRPRIVLHESPRATRFGSNDDEDFYHALCLLSRYYWTFANDRLDEPADVRVLAEGSYDLADEERRSLEAYLAKGGALLVLGRSEAAVEKGDVVAELAAGATVEETADGIWHTLEGGGRLVLLKPEGAVSNKYIASPTRPPKLEEKARSDRLLRIVEALVGSGKSTVVQK